MSVFKVKDIAKQYKEEANSALPPLVYKYLAQQGYVVQDTSVIGIIFSDSDDDLLEGLLGSLTDKLNDLADGLTDKIMGKMMLKKKAMRKQAESSSRVEQDAEAPLEFDEPTASDTMYSEPVDLPKASNALGEDYPNTSGHINEASDYYKTNKETGHVEFVHRSGTCIKIDVDGNCTIYSTGSVKQVVGGSFTLDVTKGIDIVAGDGIYLHGKEFTIKSDDKIDIKSMDFKIDGTDLTLKGSGLKVDTPKSEFTSTILDAKTATTSLGATGVKSLSVG